MAGEDADRAVLFERVAEVLAVHAPTVYEGLLLVQARRLGQMMSSNPKQAAMFEAKYSEVSEVLDALSRVLACVPEGGVVGLDEEFYVDNLLFKKWAEYVPPASPIRPT